MLILGEITRSLSLFSLSLSLSLSFSHAYSYTKLLWLCHGLHILRSFMECIKDGWGSSIYILLGETRVEKRASHLASGEKRMRRITENSGRGGMQVGKLQVGKHYCRHSIRCERARKRKFTSGTQCGYNHSSTYTRLYLCFHEFTSK